MQIYQKLRKQSATFYLKTPNNQGNYQFKQKIALQKNEYSVTPFSHQPG